jgi:hypothetical protein
MSHDPPVVYYNLFNGIMVHEMSTSPLKSLGGNVSKAEMF